ncbi:MAG: CBS domain-containing protein [Desulfovibrio sp.]|nr:MAG: CBS domain-containing protein [Desulfovibrio sp.]
MTQLAQDIMTPDVVTVTPETDILEAAKLMLEGHFNGLPVVDGSGALKGVICQSDLITQQKRLNLPSVFTLLDSFIPLSSTSAFEQEVKKMTATTVGQAMTEDVVTVEPSTTVEEVATLMVDKKLHTLPVVDGGSLVGVIGKEDVLQVLLP